MAGLLAAIGPALLRAARRRAPFAPAPFHKPEAPARDTIRIAKQPFPSLARRACVGCLLLAASCGVAHAQWPFESLFRRSAAETVVSTTPHPAIARVTVQEKDGISFGTGSLIDARGDFGLVITNWHVIRDATGEISVEFPGGFRTTAKRVLKADKDWDLAALEITRPPVEPLPISTAKPQPGEPLTIAGYGPGQFRAVAGRCTQYVAPHENAPFEMVELNVEARQGDSGGPILNQRGEISGVLFGARDGSTAGTYGGRVLNFLASVVPNGTPGSDRPGGVPPPAALAQSNVAAIAPLSQHAAPADPFAALAPETGDQLEAMSLHPADAARRAFANRPPAAAEPPRNTLPQEEVSLVPIPRRGERAAPPMAASTPAEAPSERQPNLEAAESAAITPVDGPPTEGTSLAPRKSARGAQAQSANSPTSDMLAAAWRQIGGTTFYDQAKTVLAFVGIISLAVFVLRLGSSSDEPIEAD